MVVKVELLDWAAAGSFATMSLDLPPVAPKAITALDGVIGIKGGDGVLIMGAEET